MNQTLRNILAVIAGAVVGMIVNMALIMISGSIVPPPEGANISTMEGLAESIHLFEPKHFLMPWLAHALGTLVGAFVAALIAKENKLVAGLIVGFHFFIGGLLMVIELPAPMWFEVLDLELAYFPMAWLGYKIASAIGKK